MGYAITSPWKVGLGVLVVRDGKVLLGLRTGSHGAGEWSLPGGKVDPGESFAECAARETYEETGLTVLNVRPLPLWTEDPFEDFNRAFITAYLQAEAPEGEPVVMEPEKCLRWDWFDPRDLPSPLFPGTGKLIADRLAAGTFGPEPASGQTCGAQEWTYVEEQDLPHVIGTCQLPAGHDSRWHREWRDGELWSKWLGPRDERAPEPYTT